jgi:hypothetical protein
MSKFVGLSRLRSTVHRSFPISGSVGDHAGYHNVHLSSEGDSNMANSEDAADKAFTALFELFSKPTKSPAKAYRTYQLTFENGEPIFTLSEVSRIMEKAFEEIFGTSRIE